MKRPISAKSREMGYIDPRKTKRAERKMGMDDPVYEAFNLGTFAAEYGGHFLGCKMPKRLQRNPYPPGRRHDEWNRGYGLADPLGDWHGRNR